MSQRVEELHCAFDKEIPCPDGCGLRNFRLRMRDRFSTAPGQVSELIVSCPSRQECEHGGNGGENDGFLKKYCSHLNGNLTPSVDPTG